MTRNPRFVAAAVFGATLFIGGCGDDAKVPAGAGAAPAAATAPVRAAAAAPAAEMLALIPEGAAGLVYIANPPTVEAAARRIASSIEPQAAGRVNLAALAASITSIDAADIDLTQGAMIAITMAPGADVPGVTVIIAVHDPAATVAKIEAQMPGIPTDTAGPFVAVTPTRGYKRGGMPAWAAGPLPVGDVVMRLDTATLMKAGGPKLLASAKEALAGLSTTTAREPGRPGQPDPTALLTAMLDSAVSALEDFAVEDLVLRINGTVIEADQVRRWRDPEASRARSMFKTAELTSLARGINGGAAISAAFGIDQQRALAFFRPLMAAQLQVLQAADRDAVLKALDSWQQVAKVSGPGFAMSGGLTPGGVQLVALTQTADAKAYRAAVAAVLGTSASRPAAINVTAGEPRTLDGASVSQWHIDADGAGAAPSRPATRPADDQRKAATAASGEQGLDLRIAELGDRVLSVVGSDEGLLARALRAARRTAADPTSELALAVEAAGPDTVCFVRIECRALARSVAAAVAHANGTESGPHFAIPAGESVPLTVIVNAVPDGLRTRISVDVGKVAAMIKSAMPK